MKRMRDEVDNPATVVDRLLGIYPTATPIYATTPLQQEAAREIERLRELMAAAAGVVAAHDAHKSYAPSSYGLLMEIENLRTILDKVKS